MLQPNMVIVTDYSLKCKKDSEILFVKCKEILPCPYCDGSLKVISSRKRVLFKQDGSVVHLMIRRLRCTACQHIHHELPDCIVPYKRCESTAVEKVLLSTGTNKQEEDYPCEKSTAVRLKSWFHSLRDYLEGSIRAVQTAYKIDNLPQLPLEPLCRQQDGWLKILVRMLVNAGRWQQTRSA